MYAIGNKYLHAFRHVQYFIDFLMSCFPKTNSCHVERQEHKNSEDSQDNLAFFEKNNGMQMKLSLKISLTPTCEITSPAF